MSEDDQIGPQIGSNAANLLYRLAHCKMAGGIEALLLEQRDSFVEDLLRALFLLFQQFLGQKALGQEQAVRQPGLRQQMGFRLDEIRNFGAFQQRRASLTRSVESHQDFLVHGYLPSSKKHCFTRFPCSSPSPPPNSPKSTPRAATAGREFMPAAAAGTAD